MTVLAQSPSSSPVPPQFFKPSATPRRWAFFLAVLSGLFYGVAFPPFNIAALSWIALVPLLVIRPADGRSAFTAGLVTGTLANLLIFFWFWTTFHSAQVSAVTTLASWIALSLILGLYFGGFFVIYSAIPDEPIRPWMGGAMWVGLEYIRSKILTGFPWALFGHTQYRDLPFVQTAALTGVDGISFLLVVFNAAAAALIAQFLLERARRRTVGPWQPNPDERTSLFSRPLIANLSAILLIVVALHVWGFFRLRSENSVTDRTIRVALLQGNIDQYQKWDERYEAGVRMSYEALLNQAVEANPDLIVWPESAVPGWIPNDKMYVEWLNRLGVRGKVPQIVGAISHVEGKDLNAAFLLSPQGELTDMYAKRKLVPFGEYVPFGGFLSRWIPYLGKIGVFASGTENHLFVVNGTRIAVNICYEAMFTDLIRRSTLGSADMIVNITNDGWFLKTGAPEQHYLTNIFRAVENGRPVVRAANTGVSAVISAFGEPLARSALLEQKLVVADVPIPRSDFHPFYQRQGAWFLTACWILLALSIFFLWRRDLPAPETERE